MSDKKKIIVVDNIFPNLDHFQTEAARIGAEIVDARLSDEQGVPALVQDADAVMNFHVPVRRPAIEGMTRCRVLVRMGVGYDAIDVEAATERGIYVVNIPDYCLDEVSDHAMALLLGLARKIVEYDGHIRGGTWTVWSAEPVRSLRGETLGIVGLGKIGRKVAAKGAAFGMRVMAYDPYLGDDIFEAFRVERLLALSDLLHQCRFVSLHTPLTAETRGLIGKDEIACMNSDSYLINTSRGPVVDILEVAKALQEGRLAGAALDVAPDEPIPETHPIRTAPHAILTPHAAWFSGKAHERMQHQAIEEVLRALTGGRPKNVVNGPQLGRRK